MILVDANLLVYAYDSSSAEHVAAKNWLEDTLGQPGLVGIPWPSMLAFVRLVSNPIIVRTPVTPTAAWHCVRQWLELSNVWIPLPGDRHPQLLGGLLADALVTSRMVPDAHLAALALEHGLTLCSTDGDFAKFAELRWINPIAPRA